MTVISGQADTSFSFICDDCEQSYPGPAYYTFDPMGCSHTTDGEEGDECTGNLCPSCAGIWLDPDQPGDTRRPKIEHYDPQLHAHLKKQADDGLI
jgi:hypothetical protein